MRIHDISLPLSDATVPWAHQEFFVDVRRGDPLSGSWWSLSTHAGTHVDTLRVVPQMSGHESTQPARPGLVRARTRPQGRVTPSADPA